MKSGVFQYVEKSTGLRKIAGKESTTFDYEIDEKGNISIATQIKDGILDTIKEKYPDYLIGAGFALLFTLNMRFAYLLFKAMIFLEPGIVRQSIYSVSFILAFGTLLWISSTALTFYNFHDRKRRLLILVIATYILRGWAWLFTALYNYFIPQIEKIPVTELMTNMKIAGLGWLSTSLPSTALMIFFCFTLFAKLYQEHNLKAINEFKIKHYIKSKEDPLKYDLKIVRDMKTGKVITVSEHDRYLHGNDLGATGTGKTSSTMLPQVNNDLNVKLLNEDKLKNALVKMVKQGKAYIEKQFDDTDFSPKYFKPNPGYEKEFEKVTAKYKSAGITVIAPDPGFPDDVYKLSKAKGFKCNRIDTVRNEDGSIKEGSIGFNPLFISENIPEHKRLKAMVQKSTLAADVMQIMFEMSGAKGDPYFASINRIATTTVSLALMLAYPRIHGGKQPTLADVRDIINKFDYLNAYLPELQKVNIEYNYAFQYIIDLITTEFLGEGRETFEKHSKGLKVQFNNFLTDPDIARILCTQESIDMDRMLSEGQITVVNIDQGGLGPVNSPAFGIFFSVSLINAILRRPGTEWTRLPHFWLIEEFPVIVNPHFEACFSQFRKFRTSMTIAVQTLDQMNKNPNLEYLKGIILNSCGFHVVFGRTNINDQDTYSQLSGMVDKVIKNEGISRTSMTSAEPQYVMSERYTTEQVERTSTHEIRDKDFQEVTFFRVDKGVAVPPVHGRVDFLRKRDWKSVRRYRVDWFKLMMEQKIVKQYKAVANGNTSNTTPITDLPPTSMKVSTGTAESEVSVAYTDKSTKTIMSAPADNHEEQQAPTVMWNVKDEAIKIANVEAAPPAPPTVHNPAPAEASTPETSEPDKIVMKIGTNHF